MSFSQSHRAILEVLEQKAAFHT